MNMSGIAERFRIDIDLLAPATKKVVRALGSYTTPSVIQPAGGEAFEAPLPRIDFTFDRNLTKGYYDIRARVTGLSTGAVGEMIKEKAVNFQGVLS